MFTRFVILLTWLISSTVVSYSQYIPVQSTIRTPQGNVPYTSYIHQPYMHNYGKPGTTNISKKYEFKIVLKNDSTFSTRTRINLSDKDNHSIIVKNKKVKQTLLPENTKSISRITFEGLKLVGIPADSCWLFKSASGKINSYSFLAEPGMNYVIAIQDGESGPIVPLTKENLEFIVGTEDPKLYKLLEKKHLIKVIVLYNDKKD